MIPKPVQRARRLIKKYGYESPDEIDLIDLLYKEGLYLKYEPSDRYQGKIVFNKHAGIITLNLNLENEYQKRYVIAQEMGHFFNERLEIRNDKLRGKDRLESMAGGQVRNEKLEIRQGGQVINDKLGGKETLESMAGGQIQNEKLEIRNDNPDIENRDAENAIRNEKSCLAADKLEIRDDKLKVCQDGRFFNEKALTQSRNKIWTRPLPEEEEVGYTQYNSGLQNELIVHEFKKDRYHYFVDANTKSIEDLIHEKEANQFAVELLMGRRWVVEAVSGKLRQKDSGQVLGVSLLKEIAEKFRVSLTAAALRYSELYKGAMAVILSKDKRIEWMACNRNFTFGKLNKYEPVPLNTRTYDIYDRLMPTNYVRNQRIRKCGYKQFLKEQEEYKAALGETVIVSSADWFESTDGYLNEIDFAMVNYNSVLTILWL